METACEVELKPSDILSVPPYSLGKLIEWKQTNLEQNDFSSCSSRSPYSLGKLIEWKQKVLLG
jgi:hypothetical protein